MDYKNAISIIEGSFFFAFLIFTILAIFDLLTHQFIDLLSVFELYSLRFSIIFFVLFLLSPYLITYITKISKKIARKYNQQKFRKEFFEEIKGSRTIDILELATKYDVNLLYIKNLLRDQISEGLLKGELKKDIFYLDENFKVMDIKEKRVKFMKENLGKFIAPYKSIKIKELVSNFKVPKDLIMMQIKKLIENGSLNGYFEGESFYRDFSSNKEDIECPYCKKKIDLKEL